MKDFILPEGNLILTDSAVLLTICPNTPADVTYFAVPFELESIWQIMDPVGIPERTERNPNLMSDFKIFDSNKVPGYSFSRPIEYSNLLTNKLNLREVNEDFLGS